MRCMQSMTRASKDDGKGSYLAANFWSTSSRPLISC